MEYYLVIAGKKARSNPTDPNHCDCTRTLHPFITSTDTFVYSVQPYNQNNGSPPPLFNNRTASPLYDLGLTYNASYGSGNGLSNTIGSSLLSNVAIDGSDLAVTNLTFADLYQTTNGVGASGLMGLGFPLNGNIWSVSVGLD